MCEPTTIAMASMAIGGVQAVLGYQGAKAAYGSQMETFQQNAANTARAAAENYSNLNIRLQQEEQVAAQERQDMEIEKAQALASAEVAAAEGGVSGLSVSAVLRDIYAQAGREEATLDSNLRMNRAYLGSELKAAHHSGKSQINSVPIPEKPSAFPYLLQGLGSAMNAYNTKLQLDSQRT